MGELTVDEIKKLYSAFNVLIILIKPHFLDLHCNNVEQQNKKAM